MDQVQQNVIANAIGQVAQQQAAAQMYAPVKPADGGKLEEYRKPNPNRDYFNQSLSQANSAQDKLDASINAQAAGASAVPAKNPSAFDDLVSSINRERYAIDKARQIAIAQEPRLQRAEAARQWMSGIGDALSGAINLGATINNATTQQMFSSAPMVNAAIEKDRAKRKAEMDKMNADLDDLQRQSTRLGIAKGQAESRESINDSKINLKKEENQMKNSWKANEMALKEAELNRKIAWDAIKAGNMMDVLKARYSKMSNDYELGKMRVAISEKKLDNAIKKNMNSNIDVTYGLMVDEIARNAGYKSWSDVLSKARGGQDSKAYELKKMFDMPVDKSSPQRMKARIGYLSHDFAPETYKRLFNGMPAEDEFETEEKTSESGNAGGAASGRSLAWYRTGGGNAGGNKSGGRSLEDIMKK